MLLLIIDLGVLWFLLNIFSDEDWDDQKLKIFGIVFSISLLGGWAARASEPYVGLIPSVGTYFLVGTICLWALGSMSFKKAAAAMGIFTAFKVLEVLALIVLFASL